MGEGVTPGPLAFLLIGIGSPIQCVLSVDRISLSTFLLLQELLAPPPRTVTQSLLAGHCIFLRLLGFPSRILAGRSGTLPRMFSAFLDFLLVVAVRPP